MLQYKDMDFNVVHHILFHDREKAAGLSYRRVGPKLPKALLPEILVDINPTAANQPKTSASEHRDPQSADRLV